MPASPDRPEVTLVNDEARAHLARTAQRFDIIQMSLIDTWAATGAGAFTLSENGLYTREGWRILLNRLTPRGVFSVSRWFSSSRSSETSRLVSLAVAALLDRHVASPAQHLVLAASGNVATLLVSPSPFDQRDRDAIERTVDAVRLPAPAGAVASGRRRAAAGHRVECLAGRAGVGHRRRPLRLLRAHRRAAVLLQHASSGQPARSRRGAAGRRRRRQSPRDGDAAGAAGADDVAGRGHRRVAAGPDRAAAGLVANGLRAGAGLLRA